MKVFITGGSGFLGTALSEELRRHGEVTVLSRRLDAADDRQGIRYLLGNPAVSGDWQVDVPDHDVVINLAGASIFHRWTADHKAAMRDSRILTTRNLVKAAGRENSRVKLLLNASAIGYYGMRGDEALDENASAGSDFLANLVRDWEAEAGKAEQFGVRVVCCRLGVILGRDGGAVSKMAGIFKLGLGSPLGTGNQWFSWIALADLVRVFMYLISREEIRGPVNCTAPQPVTNREMSLALGKVLGRPVFMPNVPAFFIRSLLGEFSSVLLQGQKVLPQKLLSRGFSFNFPEIEAALSVAL